MHHRDHASVRLEVGRPVIGRTAKNRMDRASVLPPYLVRPFPAHAHRGAHTHARAQVQLCLQVGQGKEVGQFQYWCGFAVVLPSSDPATRLGRDSPSRIRCQLQRNFTRAMNSLARHITFP